MELGWIRPCGRLGEGLGRLERRWSVPSMEFWIGESDRRKQVRQHCLMISAMALNQVIQIPRHIHERYQGPCGTLNLIFESTFSILNSSGALVTSNSSSFLIPMDVVSDK